MSETVAYRVPGMSCEHCRVAVTNEVSSVAGVEALRAAIDEAGYEVA